MVATVPRQFVLPSMAGRAGPAARILPARPIRALMTIPCETVGVGRTCRSILSSAIVAGYRADLTTARFNGPRPEGLRVQQGVRPILRHVPFGRRLSNEVLHRRYLDGVEEGDIAYLWPSVPVSVYERLARRGVMGNPARVVENNIVTGPWGIRLDKGNDSPVKR